MHGALTHEAEIMARLAVFSVTYCHPRLIKTGNPSGQIMHATIEDLEVLADKLEGGEKCITN